MDRLAHGVSPAELGTESGYIFDAVAEFKVSKMLAARLNPDSIRRLKDSLLRARADQLDNADAEVRQQAEAQLFDGASDQPGVQL